MARTLSTPHPAPPPVLRVLAAGLAAVIAAAAAGHDFWLTPASFTPALNAPLAIEVNVGHAGSAEARPRRDDRIERFVVRGPEGTTDVPGLDGRRPAGFVRPTAAGWYVVAYESDFARSELPAARFEGYLHEVGLEHVVEDRRVRGAASRDESERYRRCAKTLVKAGAEGSSGATSGAADTNDCGSDESGKDTPTPAPAYAQPLGLPVELVPLSIAPPASGEAGAIRLRLLHDGAPAAGVRVELKDAATGEHVASARSGDAGAPGEVRFELPRAGAWLITAVHMRKAPADSGAVWESTWASFTFDV